VSTGNSYTDVATSKTDAIIAIEMATGAHRWVTQVTRDDNWTVGCWEPKSINCPEVEGDDRDFASPPILQSLSDGTQLLLASQKSGDVFALDPEQGKVRWHAKSSGSILYGPAADAQRIYIAHSDVGGLTALKIASGESVWHTPAPAAKCSWGESMCSSAQPSAVSSIPGVVFAGSNDGHIRAYSTQHGTIVWDFDTAARPHDGVNAAVATGGAVGGFPQTVANGRLYVSSGYSFNARGGNALLVFTVDGK
jgi:polyvinyl alcohol dehydrogenase (cytochrome)